MGATVLELVLRVSDPELLADLERHPEGAAREQFALSALRIGALALRQAQGRLDADAVRGEGERLMGALEHSLTEHRRAVGEQLASSLREYFDPQSGRFHERVERLVRQDGELEQLLRRQIGREDSELGKTLAANFGDQSPLMKLLSPNESDGLLHTLGQSLEEALAGQRERILCEFSLDNKEGALSRLVAELSDRHGQVGTALEERIDTVVAEFSLDKEDSGLSRLMQRVERAQQQISSEFSLDEEASALARMRRELLEVLAAHREGTARFQEEVMTALAAMSARKQEAQRSTRHGEEFEAAVFGFLQQASQKTGDVATHTGTTTGLVRGCKVGDAVVELGPESAAAGARIAVEAKQNAGCDLAAAREEIAQARKNRGAEVGLFVYSSRSAPEGLEPLARYGCDVFAIWDAEDPHSDVYLEAGLSVARALCARGAAQREAQQVDLASIERAIREIERQSGGLEEIRRSTETIKSSSEKVLRRARIMGEGLAAQIEALDEHLQDLAAGLGAGGSDDA